MNKKISIMSLGCKVNLYESVSVLNTFLDNGFTEASFDDICDVYIINTCTVTQTSDSKSKKMIRQAIRRNDKAIICVMGCFAQLNNEEIKKSELPEDEEKLYLEDVQDLITKYNKIVDEKVKEKEEELMQI